MKMLGRFALAFALASSVLAVDVAAGPRGGGGGGGRGGGGAGRGAGAGGAGVGRGGSLGVGAGSIGVGGSAGVGGGAARAAGVGGGAVGPGQLNNYLGGAPGVGAPGVGAPGAGARLQSPLGVGQIGQAGALPAGAHAWVNNIPGAGTPFAAGWNNVHPTAWQAAHPHADAWAVSNLGATNAWLAAAAVTDGGAATTTYDATAYAPPLGAAAVAGSDGEWLPLGVFALTKPASNDRQLVQLAVNRTGEIQGAYYDHFLATSVDVTGMVDRGTQQARWTLSSNPQTVFDAPLATLTSATGSVTVTSSAGQEIWTATRLEAAVQ